MAVEKLVIDEKYTVIFHDGELYAERYGEKWRDCLGDNLIYAMFVKICKLENKFGYNE
jgi:hypothetical protein